MLDALQSELKDKMCQWLVHGDSSSVRFDGQLKEIHPGNYFWSIAAKVKGAKSMQISVNKPVTVQKQENDQALKYNVFHDNKLALTVGYMK